MLLGRRVLLVDHARRSPLSNNTTTKRQLSSSSSPPSATTTGSGGAGGTPKSSKKDPPTLQNVALASALFGFVTYVFFYSMNSVGRADGGGGGEDPLAQLKAEAHEAMMQGGQADRSHNKKLTPEEIEALESGMSSPRFAAAGDGNVEVAVAAPADIAAIEEEANLRVFRQRQKEFGGGGGDNDKKVEKPWWRFGF